MLLKRLFTSLALGTMLLSQSAMAAKPTYAELLAELNRLLSLKDYVTAYQYADQHTYEYGGEPEFDLLSGFAAYGNEKYQEAVFAFERVVLIKPSSFLARYFLAQTYEKVDNLHAAITELEKLLTRPITQVQREKSEALLRRVNRQLVERKRSWYQQFSTTMAYDNNVNSGTDKDEIYIPALDANIQLFDSAKKTQDLSYSFSYAAGYQHPLTQYQWVRVDLSANHVGFAKFNEYQRQQLGLTVSYEQELLRGQVSVSGYSRPLWLEQDVEISETSGDQNNQGGSVISQDLDREIARFRTENGIALFFQKNTSRKTSYRAGVNYAKVIDETDGDLDLTRTKVSGAFQYKTALLHTIMLHYQQDVTDLDTLTSNDKNVIGATYQLTWPISSNIVSNSFVVYETHKYQDEHPFFKETRDESLMAITSQLLFNSSENLQQKLQLSYQDKNSNVELYEFDRLEISASWQYRF